MDFKDILVLYSSAEGYYSGAKAEAAAFVTKKFYEENKEIIDGATYSFGELDGKHSNVEGEIDIIELNKDNFHLYMNINEIQYMRNYKLQKDLDIDDPSDILNFLDSKLNEYSREDMSGNKIFVGDKVVYSSSYIHIYIGQITKITPKGVMIDGVTFRDRRDVLKID